MKQMEAKLIEEAVLAMRRAYAPYSHFQVGAALEAEDGRIFTGCNVENASYGASNCAERTAVFKAVSEGVRKISAIAIVGGPGGDWSDYASPCGICRQVLAEFGGPELVVILARKDGSVRRFTLSQLLPEAFTPEALSKDIDLISFL